MRAYVHSHGIDAKPTAKTAESISISPNRPKTPNSPIGAKGQYIDETDGPRDIADGSSE